MAVLRITDRLAIDESELEERFVLASGPGGQNVNKVSTAVELRFDLFGSPSVPEPVRRRAAHLAGQRLTQDGVIVIFARRFRSQDMNRTDARERLAELLRAATVEPRPRRPTRPTLASKTRRLEGKTRRADVKKGRRPPGEEG